MQQTRVRVSRTLLYNLYRPHSHFSSVPNRPRRPPRRSPDDPDEDRFLRDLNFGSGDGRTTGRLNRPLRGERSPDQFASEEPSRPQRPPPGRNPNRPMRGMRRDGDGDGYGDDFDPPGRNSTARFGNRSARGGEEWSDRSRKIADSKDGTFRTSGSVNGDDFDAPRRNSTTRFASRPVRGGEEWTDRSRRISDTKDGNFNTTGSVRGSDQIGSSVLQNLKFGGEAEETGGNAPTQVADRAIGGAELNDGSPEFGDGGGRGTFGSSLLQNLKLGEERASHKAEEIPITRTDPTVSDSSVKDADEIFKKMKETGLIPNAVAMLDGLCKDGLVQEAMKLFGLMREKGTIPDVVVYTAVVEGFCRAERFDDAKRVFRKMQKNGILPNAFSYRVLIQGLCRGRMLEDSLDFCKEMIEAGHSPNAATFIGLIEGFCTEKGVEETESAIRTLRESGFAVDDKGVREHLDKKGPFSPMVQEAIFGKKQSQTAF